MYQSHLWSIEGRLAIADGKADRIHKANLLDMEQLVEISFAPQQALIRCNTTRVYSLACCSLARSDQAASSTPGHAACLHALWGAQGLMPAYSLKCLLDYIIF